MKDNIISNIDLASEGKKRIEWARLHMPVLESIRKQYERDKPLLGVNVTACLHVTVETANLVYTLKAGGANVALTASNPLSTQDDVAAALASDGINVYAIYGEDEKQYYECIEEALKIEPHITLDDGADTIAVVHEKHPELTEHIKAGCEETTTGVIRLRAMAKDGALRYPVIAVNDAETKMMFDNRYGTGQSALHGIMNATNVLFAGKTVVVSGYGWCGRGIAMRARGLGANVVVVEVEARKALEAVMDGYRVMPMLDASAVGDIFITATGDIAVINREHFEVMKDNAIVANSGHFNVEINIPALVEMAVSTKEMKKDVVEYVLSDGRKIYILAEGRLVNLASAYGHPPEVMDMSFANQALTAKYINENSEKLENKVYTVPPEIDNTVAKLKLDAMGIKTESLTSEQKTYLSSWTMGT
ncbi:MAG: adenosylhomocysteinase [Candidatus Argoarchaeum ethanivorans]|uniref:S-inosyl-L-homocysteine hydrolase n=1 Tax=Candidatus Argoarchaeum ethanivorans TaxID=2608793 RepID=A0A8B3S428_9EURY|nr:MAG: adenosylhomocysteinase [Candidatus Argoarchaeum ethanivorans]